VEAIFKERFNTIERVFGWEDKFRHLLLRFERLSELHYAFKSPSGQIPRSSLRSSDLLPFYHQYPAACCGDFLFVGLCDDQSAPLLLTPSIMAPEL
jgi:hypothetical protein